MLVIFFSEFFILLFEDAIIPLKKILLHHDSLQLIPQDPHLRSICLILSDKVFDFFFIDAVKLICFEFKDTFPEFIVFFL